MPEADKRRIEALENRMRNRMVNITNRPTAKIDDLLSTQSGSRTTPQLPCGRSPAAGPSSPSLVENHEFCPYCSEGAHRRSARLQQAESLMTAQSGSPTSS